MYSSSCGVKTLFVGIATAPILHIAKSENKYSSEFFKYTKTLSPLFIPNYFKFLPISETIDRISPELYFSPFVGLYKTFLSKRFEFASKKVVIFNIYISSLTIAFVSSMVEASPPKSGVFILPSLITFSTALFMLFDTSHSPK